MDGLVAAVVEFGLLSVPTAVYLWLRRRQPDHGLAVMGLTPGTPRDYARGLGIAVLLISLGITITHVIPADVIRAAGATNHITSISVALAVAVRSAAEEVFFRGFLQGVITNSFGTVAGIWVQAVLFLAVHLTLLTVSPQVWPILLLQFVTGVVLGWLRARNDSIGPPIAVHVASNLIAGLGI